MTDNGSITEDVEMTPTNSTHDLKTEHRIRVKGNRDHTTKYDELNRFDDFDFQMDVDSSSDYKEMRESIIHKRRHSTSKDKNMNVLSSHILGLPTEILVQIFHYLDRKDLYNLLAVCKEFAELIIEILWFRPNMQNDSSFKNIKSVMQRPRESNYWDYRSFIKRLNLSFMTKLVDDELLSLFAGCAKLERLTLVNCTKLTHGPIAKVLQNCQRLQSIDLTGVTDIHNNIMISLAENCPRLQGLYAPGCGNVSEDIIIKLLESCPMLKRVKFNSSTNITDKTIAIMLKHCKSLVEIDLHNCPNVSDKYLKFIFLEFTQLREFRISNAPGITDGLLDLLPPGFCLEKLRIIDIAGCNVITDKLVEKFVTFAPRLRNVVLSKCMQITDASLRYLAQLGRSLHYIHLGHCSLITDFGVASLVRSCHRIQYIDLACCSQLTDWTLVELATLPKLRRIGLVRCNLISDSGILELVRRRGEGDCLERVHLSYCTNLTIGPIYLLLKNCPKLTHLSLTGVSAFLRREITQYCREPPPDFNEQQRNSFCVFSGHGVTHLRSHLNQVMEDRSYMIDHGDMHALFHERRRMFLNGANETDDDLNLWAGQRGLGVIQGNLMNNGMTDINRELFRELNEGNMGPDEMRDHFQRLIRNYHQQRIMQPQEQNPQHDLNPIIFDLRNAPQIGQAAVFLQNQDGQAERDIGNDARNDAEIEIDNVDFYDEGE